MADNRNPKKDSPAGSLLIGVSFLALASFWPELTGARPDPATQLYMGFFKVMGWLAVFGGLTGFYKAWRRNEKRRASEVPSGIYGNAAFATLMQCAAAGLLDPRGLYLGMLEGHPLFFILTAHALMISAARSGKGTDFVLPNLFHLGDSMVVTDMKGELAAVTAQHRAMRLGHKIIVLNPWGLHGLPSHRINPLQILIKLASDPALQRGLSDGIKGIVLQLLPEPEDQRNKYFRDGARAIQRAVLIYLALHAPERCTLPELWRIVTSPRRLERAIAKMCESDALGGLLADLGDNLAAQIEDNPDQFADFRSSAVQAVEIYEPGGYLGDALSGSDIDLEELKTGKVTIYLAFPQDKIASHGTALGLIVNQAIAAIVRSTGKRKVLFVLDEFANLGKLSGLAESLTALPGLGVRVWMIVQEFAELKRIYGPQTATTILSQSEVKQYLAVRDPEFAERLSRALGQKTVKTTNFNLGRTDEDEIGESLSETGQPLMRIEDILELSRNEQLLMVNGVKPIRAQRFPFWFVQPWASWAQDNPVEGPTPIAPPLLQLEYAKKENGDE